MQLTSDEQHTINLYNDWFRNRQSMGEPLWVDSFSSPIFRNMSKDGEVIDIGCGTGRAIGILNGLGIKKYFGIDPSVEAIRFCKENFPEYAFEISDVRLVGTSYPARFSGFLMLTTLMHIPRPQLDCALSSLRNCLQDGSPGMISFPFGDEDFLEVINTVGMRLTLFAFEEIEEALKRNGFRPDALLTHDGHMLLGRVTAV